MLHISECQSQRCWTFSTFSAHWAALYCPPDVEMAIYGNIYFFQSLKSNCFVPVAQPWPQSEYLMFCNISQHKADNPSANITFPLHILPSCPAGLLKSASFTFFYLIPRCSAKSVFPLFMCTTCLPLDALLPRIGTSLLTGSCYDTNCLKYNTGCNLVWPGSHPVTARCYSRVYSNSWGQAHVSTPLTTREGWTTWRSRHCAPCPG